MLSAKKRILIIGHTYNSPINRNKFICSSKDERFNLLLLTPRKWNNYLNKSINSEEEKVNNYRAVFCNVWFGFHFLIYLIKDLKKIIDDFQPDLIYCEQEPQSFVSFQVSFISRKIPVIYFSWENINRDDIIYTLFKPLRDFSYRSSVLMTAGSKDAARVMRSHGYKKLILVSPILGVNENIFIPLKGKKIENNKNSDHFTIGYIGRFVDEKDVQTLIKAVSLVLKDIKCQLRLIGNGPLKEEYKRLTDNLGLTEIVHFYPPVMHDKIPEIMREFDCLVLPSKTTKKWKEQFGHVIIEAMACGVAVIGSSSGEIPNVIGDAGLIFEEGDSQGLAEKILLLNSDYELRKNLIKKGIERVRQKYTDKSISNNMLAIFEHALNLEKITPNTLEICN